MNVLFEEDGAFKAGSVLADNVTSLQVELPGGKRVKVKSASVLLRFAQPSAAELLERAEADAEAMEADFLWEASTDGEFAFDELAREYFGRAALPVESAAILLRLHAAPIYFHRKGKGRFRKAPPEILAAALAGLEKKRQQALAIERMANELEAGRLPAEFAPLLKQLFYKPDRNRSETKALELACAQCGLSAAHLLNRCGAIPSTHDYHLERFLFAYFPQGTAFGAFEPARTPVALPRAQVTAFSIDDATTTEIDDAFSVTPLPAEQGGGWRVGIHIAVPGLGVRPGSALDAIARSRLLTVYIPGRKITMLPDAVIEGFTLSAGRECPALSLYLECGSDFTLRAHETRVEIVPIAANLRHHDIEPLFNERTLADGGPGFPYKRELTLLWELATVLEAGRGKSSNSQGMTEFNFYVDWTQADGRIEIVERRRGSPLDKLVAELMIVANSTWGRVLADAGVAAIYRAQSNGKVRMTTAAAAHDGLGVDCYAWASSPLRRYVDLLNQWQLLAHLAGEVPAFTARSEALLAAMRDFELTYAAYAEFQRNMERYWCLRWLIQQGALDTPLAARIVRDNLLRLESVPLFLRCQGLPPSASVTGGPTRPRVSVAVSNIDLLDLDAQCRYLETLGMETEVFDEDAVPE